MASRFAGCSLIYSFPLMESSTKKLGKRWCIPYNKTRVFYGTDQPCRPTLFPKAYGSREHSEPWSEGGGNRQLCWLFISTKPERKKIDGSREHSEPWSGKAGRRRLCRQSIYPAAGAKKGDGSRERSEPWSNKAERRRLCRRSIYPAAGAKKRRFPWPGHLPHLYPAHPL